MATEDASEVLDIPIYFTRKKERKRMEKSGSDQAHFFLLSTGLWTNFADIDKFVRKKKSQYGDLLVHNKTTDPHEIGKEF